MPLVNVRVIEGVFDEDEKRAMIEKLTDTMVEIEGENMRGVTWVVIDEVKSGDWGLGGKALTTEDVLGSRTAFPPDLAVADAVEPASRAVAPRRAGTPTSTASASPTRCSGRASRRCCCSRRGRSSTRASGSSRCPTWRATSA